MLPMAAFANDYGWLSFGDLRGNIEPCGCDPETDLGGIRRINTVITRERLFDPLLKVYDLGNNLPLNMTAFGNKAKYLDLGLAQIKADAALFNVLEINAAQEGFEFAKNRKFVLSNSKTKFDKIVASSVVVGDRKFFGYVYRKDLDYSLQTILENPDIFKKLDPNKNKKNTLLFSGPDAHLQVVLDLKLFDEIISSNRADLTETPTFAEKANIELLKRTLKDETVWMVPVGGQGLLRGGNKLFSIAQPIFSLDKSAAIDASPIFKEVTQVTWLDNNEEKPESLKEVFDAYNKSQKKDFFEYAAHRAKALKASNFAGAAACKACHSVEYQVWEQSAHANAYSTLKNKSKNQDLECVKCHVVGGDEVGGFASLETSPHLKNVQCENCHGPRKEHINNPVPPEFKQQSAKNACKSCHHIPHSADFQFEKYWKRIKH